MLWFGNKLFFSHVVSHSISQFHNGKKDIVELTQTIWIRPSLLTHRSNQLLNGPEVMVTNEQQNEILKKSKILFSYTGLIVEAWRQRQHTWWGMIDGSLSTTGSKQVAVTALTSSTVSFIELSIRGHTDPISFTKSCHRRPKKSL